MNRKLRVIKKDCSTCLWKVHGRCWLEEYSECWRLGMWESRNKARQKAQGVITVTGDITVNSNSTLHFK